jgi:hypothetical protein
MEFINFMISGSIFLKSPVQRKEMVYGSAGNYPEMITA